VYDRSTLIIDFNLTEVLLVDRIIYL